MSETTCFKTHSVGVTFKNDTTYADWETFGKMLATVSGSIMWFLGDWINFGEAKFGEKYTQAMNFTKYDYGTLANAAYCCRKYEPKDRRPRLSWRHHFDCARFELGDRTAILDQVERMDMSSTQLREFLHRQFPSAYKSISSGSIPKSFDTYWARYAQSLSVEVAQDASIIDIAKDAFRAGQKSVDSTSV